MERAEQQQKKEKAGHRGKLVVKAYHLFQLFHNQFVFRENNTLPHYLLTHHVRGQALDFLFALPDEAGTACLDTHALSSLGPLGGQEQGHGSA